MAHLSHLATVATVSKHLIAGIVVIVVGALVALFGFLRAARRESGAMLVTAVGIVVVIVGVLVVTHTIRP
jgi:Na+-driven multidrug efflux pump